MWEIVDDGEIPAADLRATMLDFDRVLGLGFAELKEEVVEEIPTEIQALADERKKAREAKDWKKSDELRDEILNKGYFIKDTADGQIKITKS